VQNKGLAFSLLLSSMVFNVIESLCFFLKIAYDNVVYGKQNVGGSQAKNETTRIAMQKPTPKHVQKSLQPL
jgi:hypothetical protein